MQPIMITRLYSLDAFRGITIAAMILVNSPGNQTAYPWLLHSAWNGCTLADLVFPFFIVIVGISATLALTNLQQAGIPKRSLFTLIMKRSIYLFGLGLLLNVLPNHFDVTHLRILGVLQRIAICYFFSATLFLTTTRRTQIIIIIVLLVGYWYLMNGFATINSLSIHHNLVGYVDQLILLPQHLYTPMFDPEGLLSTLPAIASVLIGNKLGMVLISFRTKTQQLQWIIVVGIMLSTLGLIWSYSFPFNKPLWSSSYALWTSGLCFLIFAICFTLIEIMHRIGWSKPFLLLGKHALLVYMLHALFLKIQAIVLIHNANGELVNLRLYITDRLFHHFSAKNASLCYAIGYTLFWLLMLYLLRYAKNNPVAPSHAKTK